MFVSCNPTLTSLYSKKSLPKVFFHRPNSNQRKACIKHTFLTKKIMQKKDFTDLPTLFFSDRYRKQTIFVLGLMFSIAVLSIVWQCQHALVSSYESRFLLSGKLGSVSIRNHLEHLFLGQWRTLSPTRVFNKSTQSSPKSLHE